MDRLKKYLMNWIVYLAANPIFKKDSGPVHAAIQATYLNTINVFFLLWLLSVNISAAAKPALKPGDEIFPRALGFKKGPVKVEAVTEDGTVSVRNQNGNTRTLSPADYIVVVKKIEQLNLQSEVIVHRLKGRGIIPVEKIGADGTVAYLNIETDEWEEFRPQDYTRVISENAELKTGGKIFPLRAGWVGAWPVKALGEDGTVVLEADTDDWFKLRRSEYVPTIEQVGEMKPKDKVIVTKSGMVGLWEIQYLGQDGRIAVYDTQREPYTLLRNEYIPTVELESREEVLSNKPGHEGVHPVIALGIDGTALIMAKDGRAILLKDNEYTSQSGTATGTQSLFSFWRKSKRSSSEPPKWVPAELSHIRRGQPLMLEARSAFLAVTRKGAKAWVYPIEAHGEKIEVLIASEVHSATKFRNSLTSYEVPLSWLMASTVAVSPEDLQEATKLDTGSLKAHFESTIPRGLGNEAAVIKYFKEQAGANPSVPCGNAMSAVAASSTQP